jgi:ribosome-associated protein
MSIFSSTTNYQPPTKLSAMQEFKLEGDFIHLIQLLKATGLVGTGGEAQMVVTQGLVKYNGAIDYRKRLKVKLGDIVEFNKHKIVLVA